MAGPDPERVAKTKVLRDKVYEKQGGDRLVAWMEYNRYVHEDSNYHEWLKGCTPYLELHSWSTDDPKHPKVVLRYTVQPDNCNASGNLHGGCTASLFDLCTSLPLTLVNKPGFWFHLGVSVTLNCSYLKPIPSGTKILIECELLSIGKTLSTLRGVMKRESDGAVLTSCEHGKYNSDLQMSKL